MEIAPFQRLSLVGGFRIARLSLVHDLEFDPLGRPALARTEIQGRSFFIAIRNELSEKEKSISLYHEILEAMTVGATEPPESVLDFNEGDFERAAVQAHRKFGPVTPLTLTYMLNSYGFREE